MVGIYILVFMKQYKNSLIFITSLSLATANLIT